MRGYGMEADLWSVGVILHLVYVDVVMAGADPQPLTP